MVIADIIKCSYLMFERLLCGIEKESYSFAGNRDLFDLTSDSSV